MSVVKLIGLVLGVSLIAVCIGGCSGDQGPVGPQGFQGPPGEPGTPRSASSIADRIFGIMVTNGTASDIQGALKVHLTGDSNAVPTADRVVARAVSKAPVIDGIDGGAEEWGTAVASDIALEPITGADLGIATASVRAAFDRRYVYLQVKWTESATGAFVVGADTTENIWRFDSTNATWRQSGGEDKLLLGWELTNVSGWDAAGMGAIFDGTTFKTPVSGGIADLWVWQSTQTFYSGYLADKVVRFSSGDGSSYDLGSTPAFVMQNSGTTRPTYMKSGSPRTGSPYPLRSWEYTKFDATKKWLNRAIIPGYVFFTPSGSTADVQAQATFVDGTWTVELRRLRETGNGDDTAF